MQRTCLTIALAAAVATGAVAQTAPPARPEPVREQYVEMGIDQLSSPFTTPTVLKLNAIVAKSKVIIDRFDAVIPSVRASVAAGAARDATPAARQQATVRLDDLVALCTRAHANLAAMMLAKRELDDRGEKYNATILAGMVQFVTDVDDELGVEHRELAAKLDAH